MDAWWVGGGVDRSVDTSTQAVTSTDTAFFSFACALPGAEAAPSPPEHSTLTGGGVKSVGVGVGVGGDSSSSDGDGGGGGGRGGFGGGGGVLGLTSSDKGEAGAEEEGDDEMEEAGSGEEQEGGGDGGWEIQEGGECTYFVSLDGGDYSAVEPAPASGAPASSSSATGEEDEHNTLLLTGLADGVHELRYAWVGGPLQGGPVRSHVWAPVFFFF